MRDTQTVFILGRRPALDGVRAVAILAVMGFHLRADTSLGTRGGWLGVQIFFVLSGFLITALLVEEHTQTGGVRLRAFYVRRALRLFPALAVMLAAVLLYASLTSGPTHGLLVEATAAAGYVDNWYRAFTHAPNTDFSHTWSLSIEEQFYLVWPLLLLCILRRRPAAALWVAVAGIAAAVTARIVELHDGAHLVRLYDGSDTRADGLFIGCALALAFHLGYVQRASMLLRATFYPALVLICGCLVALSWRVSSTYEFGLLAFSLAVGVVLANLVARRTWLNVLLESRPLRGLGLISYAVYLWHYPVFQTLPHYRLPATGTLDIALSIGLAAASFFLVERPFLRLKKRLAASSGKDIARSSTRPVPPAAVV